MRRRLYEMAKAPTTATAAARALCVSRLTARYHLEILARIGLVVPIRVGKGRFYSQNGTHDSSTRRTMLILRHDPARRVAQALATRPQASLRSIAKTTGLTVSATYWQVNRLEREGLLRTERARRGISYELSAIAQSTLDAQAVRDA